MSVPQNCAWNWTALGMSLDEAQKHLDQIIMCTPSGEQRNDVTELNIDLLRLQDKFKAMVAKHR